MLPRRNIHATTGRRLWNDEVEVLVKAGRSRPRFLSDVAAALSRKLGERIERQRVEMWLRRAGQKRVVPSYGVGKLLLEAVQETLGAQ